MGVHAIVLAAGQGTRMKSDRLKVMHHLAGLPIIKHVVNTVTSLKIDRTFVVVGHQGYRVRDALADRSVSFVHQAEQLGTGHAVMQVREQLSDVPNDLVLVLAGDCPLISGETLQDMVDLCCKTQTKACVLTAVMKEPGQYGRIIRKNSGEVLGIREARDCNESELTIDEINTGIYCFQVGALFHGLTQVKTDNSQGEYYLTDVLHLIREAHGKVSAVKTLDADQVIGINTRQDLANSHRYFYQKQTQKWMDQGVTIVDPATTFIDADVVIGRDSIVYPFSVLRGQTMIGANCEVGPHVCLEDVVLGDGQSAKSLMSHQYQSEMLS